MVSFGFDFHRNKYLKNYDDGIFGVPLCLKNMVCIRVTSVVPQCFIWYVVAHCIFILINYSAPLALEALVHRLLPSDRARLAVFTQVFVLHSAASSYIFNTQQVESVFFLI